MGYSGEKFRKFKREVCIEAVEHYGKGHQLVKAMEEMAELTAELARTADTRTTNRHICEEIADVMIMMKQLTIIFGESKVHEIEEFKIQRLKDNMDSDNYEHGNN